MTLTKAQLSNQLLNEIGMNTHSMIGGARKKQLSGMSITQLRAELSRVRMNKSRLGIRGGARKRSRKASRSRSSRSRSRGSRSRSRSRSRSSRSRSRSRGSRGSMSKGNKIYSGSNYDKMLRLSLATALALSGNMKIEPMAISTSNRKNKNIKINMGNIKTNMGVKIGSIKTNVKKNENIKPNVKKIENIKRNVKKMGNIKPNPNVKAPEMLRITNVNVAAKKNNKNKNKNLNVILYTGNKNKTNKNNSSMTNVDRYYEILGLPQSATKRDVIKAYHKLALIYHPNKYEFFPMKNKMSKLQVEEYWAKIDKAYTYFKGLSNFA